MGNSEGNRHFRPDKYSAIVHKARKTEGVVRHSDSNSPKNVARVEGKVESSSRANDPKLRVTRELSKRTHLREQEHLLSPDDDKKPDPDPEMK